MADNKRKKAKARRKAPERVATSVRLPSKVVDGLDEMADDLGVSRNRVIEMMLGQVVAMSDVMETPGLFDPMAELVEAAVKKALVEQSIPRSLRGRRG